MQVPISLAIFYLNWHSSFVSLCFAMLMSSFTEPTYLPTGNRSAHPHTNATAALPLPLAVLLPVHNNNSNSNNNNNNKTRHSNVNKGNVNASEFPKQSLMLSEQIPRLQIPVMRIPMRIARVMSLTMPMPLPMPMPFGNRLLRKMKRAVGLWPRNAGSGPGGGGTPVCICICIKKMFVWCWILCFV